MLYDFDNPSLYSHQKVRWYVVVMALYTLWNYFIFKNRLPGFYLPIYLVRDLCEDFCLYAQWLHYQKLVSIKVALLPVHIWLGVMLLERCCLKSNSYLDGNRGRSRIGHSRYLRNITFVFGHGCNLKFLIVLSGLLTESPLKDGVLSGVIALGVLQIFFVVVYCSCGFLENAVCPCEFATKRWMEVAALEFDSTDINRHWDKKFSKTPNHYLTSDKDDSQSVTINVNPFGCKKNTCGEIDPEDPSKEKLWRNWPPEAYNPVWVNARSDRDHHIAYLHRHENGTLRKLRAGLTSYEYFRQPNILQVDSDEDSGPDEVSVNEMDIRRDRNAQIQREDSIDQIMSESKLPVIFEVANSKLQRSRDNSPPVGTSQIEIYRRDPTGGLDISNEIPSEFSPLRLGKNIIPNSVPFMGVTEIDPEAVKITSKIFEDLPVESQR